MKALVIYDSNGKIYGIYYGMDEIPPGLQSMFVDIPDGAQLESIDVSDPVYPKPIFAELPESDIDKLREEIKHTNAAIASEAKRIDSVMLAATFTAVTFTDEQALQVPELYPEWSPDSISYKTGERIRYNSILYKVLQDHTSQESWTPDTAHSLFAKVLIENPDIIPDWEQPSAENAYMTGDKVRHKEKVWESLVDNNVWEPGVIGTESLWKEVE